jgi:hypothetical protein
MKLVLLALTAALLAAIPCAMAVDCSKTAITVSEGEYVELATTPGPGTGTTPNYIYMWTVDNGITLSPDTASYKVSFYAPSVSTCTEYDLNVLVTSNLLGTSYGSCVKDECIKFSVCPVECPIDYYQECATNFASKTYTYTGHWNNNYTFVWTINGTAHTQIYDAVLMPKPYEYIVAKSELSPLPSQDHPKVCYEMKLDVYDAAGTHILDSASCSNEICLVYEPVVSITPSTVPITQ